MITQADMNACQKMHFDAADARLAAINAAAIANRVMPGDRFAPVRVTEVDRLIRAQMAWATYRQAQCDADVFLSRGGSEEPMYFYACMQAMTEVRLAALAVDAPESVLPSIWSTRAKAICSRIDVGD